MTYQGRKTDQERHELGKLIIDVDEARLALHAQHHPHGVLDYFPFADRQNEAEEAPAETHD